MRSIATIILVVGLAAAAAAQSIELVGSVPLQPSSVADSFLGRLLLGRSDAPPINPQALCGAGDHRLALTDAIHGLVLVIDDTGVVRHRLDRVDGRRLMSPVGICRDARGYLYIADSGRSVVLRADSRLGDARVFVRAPRRRLTGLAWQAGHLYAVDTLNHQVVIYDDRGHETDTFGRRGTAPGEFNFPTHLSAAAGKIYVTDALNFRVQVFDPDGRFVRQVGSEGIGGGNFAKPKGVAVDGTGRIYVADAMFDNVQVFSDRGEFLTWFGGPGAEPGRFWMPAGVCLAADDRIWVADTYNRRLQVFRVVKGGGK